MLFLMLFNFFAMPYIADRQIEDTDYGTFITMTENDEIGHVQV